MQISGACSKFEAAFSNLDKVGNPQWTRGAYGAEHAARSENMVRDTVKDGGIGNVDKIYYNNSINTIFPGADINKLPDAVVKWKDGRFTLIEVVSPSQTAQSQAEKLREMARQLEKRREKGLTSGLIVLGPKENRRLAARAAARRVVKAKAGTARAVVTEGVVDADRNLLI